MDWKRMHTSGIELLIQRFREEFRIPENLNYYSQEDYQNAEKKFIRFCLDTGGLPKTVSEDKFDSASFGDR